MSTVQEIQAAIKGLPRNQVTDLLEWIQMEYDDDGWDRQMKEDAAEGRLDHLMEQGRRALRNGQAVKFP